MIGMQMQIAIQKARFQHSLLLTSVEWHISTPLLLPAARSTWLSQGSLWLKAVGWKLGRCLLTSQSGSPKRVLLSYRGQIILRKTQSRDMHSYHIFISWKSSFKPKTFTHSQLFLILTGHAGRKTNTREESVHGPP